MYTLFLLPQPSSGISIFELPVSKLHKKFSLHTTIITKLLKWHQTTTTLTLQSKFQHNLTEKVYLLILNQM